MSDKQIVFAKADDWIALYIDGELATQNHSLSIQDVLEIVGIVSESRNVDDEWAYDLGRFPDNISEVKWEE